MHHASSSRRRYEIPMPGPLSDHPSFIEDLGHALNLQNVSNGPFGRTTGFSRHSRYRQSGRGLAQAAALAVGCHTQPRDTRTACWRAPFERSTRRLSATNEGQRLVTHARRLLAAYDTAVCENVAAPPQGLLRVTAPMVFGQVHDARCNEVLDAPSRNPGGPRPVCPQCGLDRQWHRPGATDRERWRIWGLSPVSWAR